MTTPPLHIGITGNIGSGKSTAARVFSLLGIPVYDSDHRAKWLMQHDEELRQELIKLFGEATYLEDGSLNRAYLAKRIFSQPEDRKAMNGLVHPAVARDALLWQAEQTDVPYTLREAALLYESGAHQWLDRMIVVAAPAELRLERVVNRDQSDPEAVKKRMDSQMPEAQKTEQADFVIYNDGKQLLLPQVLSIHQQLCHVAKN